MKKRCEGNQCVQKCPNDWKEHGDRCYLWSDKKRTWADAEELCKKKGGHLASVTSEAVDAYIAGEKEKRWLKNLWIGGSDKEIEGVWKWTDGSPWNFTNWYIGQPNNLRGHDCLRYINDKKEWDDTACNLVSPFVCTQILGSGVV